MTSHCHHGPDDHGADDARSWRCESVYADEILSRPPRDYFDEEFDRYYGRPRGFYGVLLEGIERAIAENAAFRRAGAREEEGQQ